MATDFSGHVRTCEDCGSRYEYDHRKGLSKRRCKACSRRRWIERRMETPLACACKDCGRRYIYDPRKGHTKRRCNSCRSNRWIDRRELKRRMVEYKGGCCQICGYDGCLRALDFHHLEPTKKRFSLAGNHLRGWDVLRPELEKCVLVCSNCHFEIEATAVPTAQTATTKSKTD